MDIYCSGDGLKKAILDGFEIMQKDGTEGFSYPIGTVRGLEVRIVVEPETGCFETSVIEGPFAFGAVTDLEEK